MLNKIISATHVIAVAVLCLVKANMASGTVRLPKLVGDGMVLQRDSKVTLWGWASPGEQVQIKFLDHVLNTKATPNGRWLVYAGPFEAGGPYEMTISGENRLTLKDILIGDVWLASGQSNMEFKVRSTNDGDREIEDARFPQVRLFVVKHNSRLKQTDDVISAGWEAVKPETVSTFSAVAYMFGRELHERYRVPIGLIESDWGGTSIGTWMSIDAAKKFAQFGFAMKSLRNAGKTEENYNEYLRRKRRWDRLHGEDDRGRVDGRDVWAELGTADQEWSTIAEPRAFPAFVTDFGGFGGVVWFRKEITIPESIARRHLKLHLGQFLEDDVTFFNGEKVGETRGYTKLREYSVPGKFVRAGRNVITVRLHGVYDPEASMGWIGMEGPRTAMRVEINGESISLAGNWSYRTGPDMRNFPAASVGTSDAHPSPTAPYYWPTLLFNGMISPLVNFRIKGVIWYQGETDALEGRAAQYRRLFPALIEDWRNHWGYEVPFLFVQLAGYGSNEREPSEYSWAELRDAQQATLSLPNTAMASAIDVGDEGDIHPTNKLVVAHRLALAAAKFVYGEDVVHSGPTFQSMKVEGERIRIGFANRGSGLLIDDKYGYARGFEISADDGKYVWARAQQDGDDIIVFSELVKHPTAVRYDWSNTPDGNLFNREGLPAVPFRSKSLGQYAGFPR